MDILAGIIFAIFFWLYPNVPVRHVCVLVGSLRKKEPIILLGLVFTWGAIFAAGAAFIVNTFAGPQCLHFLQAQKPPLS